MSVQRSLSFLQTRVTLVGADCTRVPQGCSPRRRALWRLALSVMLLVSTALGCTLAAAMPSRAGRAARKSNPNKDTACRAAVQPIVESVALRHAGRGAATGHVAGQGAAHGPQGDRASGEDRGGLADRSGLCDRVVLSEKDWLDRHAARIAGKNQELHCDLCASSAAQAADIGPGERAIAPQIDVRAWTNKFTTLRLDDAVVKVTGLNPFGVQIRKPF